MKTDTQPSNWRMPIPTPEGEFTAHYSAHGLCGLEFPTGIRQRETKAGATVPTAQIRQWHGAVSKALKLALAGRPPKRLPPLDLSGGTDFQQRVWRALRQIGWGRTKSYAQVAEAIGNAKAVRAVGGACAANPIPVFVPCHRVLAANQGLGGFSGGLAWKRRLLACEGCHWQDLQAQCLPEKEQLPKTMQKARGTGRTVKNGQIKIQGDKEGSFFL